MPGLHYVEPSQVRIWEVEGSIDVRVEITDQLCVRSARLKRVFPLSHPNDYLSILDGANKEVGILRGLEGLTPESRRIAETHLDRRYFTPQVAGVLELKQEAGMWRFVVDTQRGQSEFFVRNWRDSAHEIAPGRWHILSVDGGRYEIPNLDKLDAHSHRLLDQVL